MLESIKSGALEIRERCFWLLGVDMGYTFSVLFHVLTCSVGPTDTAATERWRFQRLVSSAVYCQIILGWQIANCYPILFPLSTIFHGELRLFDR